MISVPAGADQVYWVAKITALVATVTVLPTQPVDASVVMVTELAGGA